MNNPNKICINKKLIVVVLLIFFAVLGTYALSGSLDLRSKAEGRALSKTLSNSTSSNSTQSSMDPNLLCQTVFNTTPSAYCPSGLVDKCGSVGGTSYQKTSMLCNEPGIDLWAFPVGVKKHCCLPKNSSTSTTSPIPTIDINRGGEGDYVGPGLITPVPANEVNLTLTPAPPGGGEEPPILNDANTCIGTSLPINCCVLDHRSCETGATDSSVDRYRWYGCTGPNGCTGLKFNGPQVGVECPDGVGKNSPGPYCP